MIKEYSYKGLKWLDLENPEEKEVNEIMHRFNVSAEAVENLLSPTPKQRVVLYPSCVYIVLHFPTLSFHKNAFQGEGHRKEIDFLVGKNFLLTVHYDPMTAIKKFSEFFERSKTEQGVEENAGVIFHRLVKHLYHSLLYDVEVIKGLLQKAENSIFKGEEKKMVAELSQIHRDILKFNNALLPHREAIEALRGIFRGFLGDSSESIIHDIKSEYDRVDRRMQSNKALLEELRHTNDSLLSAKQNEAMKGLTMMAFITFPLTLIAAIFAMRTESTPFIGNRYDFVIVICIMLIVILSCVTFFKYKKWL
ncbi:MAG TPA: CorA family divalent cation transporter [Candidatus Paceibacterota bacterium]